MTARPTPLAQASLAVAGAIAVLVTSAAMWITTSHPADVVFAITATSSHTPTITPTITPGGPTLTPTPLGRHLALDLNVNNGAAPCDIIDGSATVSTGSQAKVAVCARDFPGSPGFFRYVVTYDDLLLHAPNIANTGAGTDDNPDANAGATTFGATSLGALWTCEVSGSNYPEGDTLAATGAGNGRAFSGLCQAGSSFTLGGTGVLGIITFDAMAPGTVALSIAQVNVLGPGASVGSMGTCAPAFESPIACLGGTLTTVGLPQPTHTPTPNPTVNVAATATPSAFAPGLYLDFNTANGSNPCDIIDATATVAAGESLFVAVCQINVPGPNGAFNYHVIYDDTIVVAPEVPDFSVGLDDNPDANAGVTTFGSTSLGPFWDCTGGVAAHPKGDNDPASGPGHGRAFSGGCSSIFGPFTLGNSGVLSVITFVGQNVGSSTITFGYSSITHDNLTESGSCNPVIDVPMACIGGTINVVPASLTPTATPTIPGVTVFKNPVNSNLWICESGPCNGPGEGDVQIDEVVNGVFDALGAWEIQIKFDHKIFNVVIDPNEALFTNFGRTPNCNVQVVTENWILFGCVSTGPVGAGFTGGPATLATITLTPNEDLRFRLHPGNDNGVTRLMLDENCEVADTLGHPVGGSVNGGLAAQCDDASVTVRVLEGDLDLDCDVDLTDEQLIASRYGTFFGNVFYDPWFDLEPALKDFDIDIKDLQKVFGRDTSTCQNPIPPQPPVDGLSVGPL